MYNNCHNICQNYEIDKQEGKPERRREEKKWDIESGQLVLNLTVYLYRLRSWHETVHVFNVDRNKKWILFIRLHHVTVYLSVPYGVCVFGFVIGIFVSALFYCRLSMRQSYFIHCCHIMVVMPFVFWPLPVIYYEFQLCAELYRRYLHDNDFDPVCVGRTKKWKPKQNNKKEVKIKLQRFHFTIKLNVGGR